MSRPPQIEPNRARMAEEAARCFQLRTQGLSLRDIAAATGLPRETVCRRIQHELDDRVAPAVAEYRALQDATLDALQAAAWNILDASHDPDVKLKAIDRLLRILERRARLHGWTPRQGGRRRHPARRPRPSWRPCSPPRTPVTRPCAPRLRAPDGGPLWVGHHRAGAGAPPLPGASARPPPRRPPRRPRRPPRGTRTKDPAFGRRR
jgi:hypothetical protein